MTTIAWDGKTMVADTRRVYGNRIIDNVLKLQKIKVRDTTLLVGIAGDGDYAGFMFDWIRSGMHPETFPEWQKTMATSCEVIIVDIKNQEVNMAIGRTPVLLLEGNRHGAIGSGDHYAIAAMYLGKTAEEAVQVAHQFDCFTGPYTASISFLARKRVSFIKEWEMPVVNFNPPLTVGDMVKALCNIWQDGDEFEQGHYCAQKGDILTVRGFNKEGHQYPVIVAKEKTPNDHFGVHLSEITRE